MSLHSPGQKPPSLLLQPYDVEDPHTPERMKITVRFEAFDPEYEDDFGVSW